MWNKKFIVSFKIYQLASRSSCGSENRALIVESPSVGTCCHKVSPVFHIHTHAAPHR